MFLTQRVLWLALTALVAQACPTQGQVTRVDVGVTPTCPYGTDFPCWPGAKEALSELRGVRSVTSVPDSYNCTARVFLGHQGLPDVADWSTKFKNMVDRAYVFRGVEVTIHGSVESEDSKLVLRAPGLRQAVLLAPLQNKLQWNLRKNAARQPEPDERKAYRKLAAALRKTKNLQVELTGPIRPGENGTILEVREFFVIPRSAN
jgi:hypothetical protein